jgi:hypothetical protein
MGYFNHKLDVMVSWHDCQFLKKTSKNSLTIGTLSPWLTSNWFSFTQLATPLAMTTDLVIYSNSFLFEEVSFMDPLALLWVPCACLTNPFQEWHQCPLNHTSSVFGTYFFSVSLSHWLSRSQSSWQKAIRAWWAASWTPTSRVVWGAVSNVCQTTRTL